MNLIYLMSARWSVGCVRGEMVLVLVHLCLTLQAPLAVTSGIALEYDVTLATQSVH